MTVKKASDRINEAALELFYKRGVRAVGVEEIVTHAGVTKPSLYRAYASKDELIGAYVEQSGAAMLERFDAIVGKWPDNPRAALLAWFEALSDRAVLPAYRGCGVSNSVVEFPAMQHPARLAALDNKQALRKRLRELCRQMNARKPKALADSLMLIMEGAFITGQLFGEDGPAGAAARAAETLIDGHMKGGG